jgi:hypothetical protein
MKRGWLILITSLLALSQLYAVLYILRLPAEIAQNLNLPLIIQISVSALWALIFVWADISLIRQRPRAVNRILYLIAVFVVYSLLRLLLFAQSDYDRQRFPFLLALVIFCTICFIVIRFSRIYRHHLVRKQTLENEIHDR